MIVDQVVLADETSVINNDQLLLLMFLNFTLGLQPSAVTLNFVASTELYNNNIYFITYHN